MRTRLHTAVHDVAHEMHGLLFQAAQATTSWGNWLGLFWLPAYWRCRANIAHHPTHAGSGR